MNKFLKIVLNILIFTLIAGFGYYMFHSMKSERLTVQSHENQSDSAFVSLYQKITSIEIASTIQCFDIYNDKIYVVLSDKVSVLDLLGKQVSDFAITTEASDIRVENETVYLLYPARIDLYAIEGELKETWKACSENADYCALTTTNDFLFVTDAENKNIVQYDKAGHLVRFIKSPEGFIIPSHAFGIISINDTLYCCNTGRHKIESYTFEGEYISSFGVSGSQAGAFSGCCNPVYLEKTTQGNILTSEKGAPRISSYERNGKFRTVLLDSRTLGGGVAAYKMKVREAHLYVAGGKKISVFEMIQ